MHDAQLHNDTLNLEQMTTFKLLCPAAFVE